MPKDPSLAIRLYGTDEPLEPARLLRAGPLTAEYDGGNLRYIRFGGVEILRAISFIVRDKDWGTYNPDIEDVVVCEAEDAFRVSYRAVAGDAAQRFHFNATIEGRADGRLVFSAEGAPATDFITNRTGFVVLHAADLAGTPATIEHVDGRIVETCFPEIIDPVQPMMDLRALTHVPAPGIRARCLMQGDTFEMEDQRNWTDASYKTYVRPLAAPWPYVLPAGETIRQSVTLTVVADINDIRPSTPVITATPAGPAKPLPSIGIGLDPRDAAATRLRLEALRALAPSHVVCHFDPRRGHDGATLRDSAGLAQSMGATPWLEAVIADVDGFEAEIEALGKMVAEIGSPFEVVLISPAPDLKCTLPGSIWPPAPSPSAFFGAARRAFPDARIGGGMFSYFTELNRKRPPLQQLDLVSFTTSAVVHAGDDRSVIETLQALPAIAVSARAIAGDKPFAVGPSAIGMRDNPYGATAKDNPSNIRQAMSFNDPRQRGLLGAAWTLGYIARFAQAGATAIALGGAAGAFGLVHAPADWPQPWFDGEGGFYPAFHVVRGFAGRKARTFRRLETSSPNEVVGIAIDRDGETDLWVANLTNNTLHLDAPIKRAMMAVLDAESFVAASRDSSFLDSQHEVSASSIELTAYAIAKITFEAADG